MVKKQNTSPLVPSRKHGVRIFWSPFIRVFAALVLTWPLLSCAVAQADFLKGRVEEQNEILRLSPPAGGSAGGQNDGQPHSLRISRQAVAPLANSQSPMLDTKAFSQALRGRADQDGARLGVLKPNEFSLPPQNKFDIGADRGSREMLLAWERWHHQLSAAIYERWSERADSPGRATLRITVTKDHHIMPTIVSSGGRHFDHGLLEAIMSLDGNAGLEFPAKSERQQVRFEADYIAGSDVQPGYSWVHNDVEKIRQDY